MRACLPTLGLQALPSSQFWCSTISASDQPIIYWQHPNINQYIAISLRISALLASSLVFGPWPMWYVRHRKPILTPHLTKLPLNDKHKTRSISCFLTLHWRRLIADLRTVTIRSNMALLSAFLVYHNQTRELFHQSVGLYQFWPWLRSSERQLICWISKVITIFLTQSYLPV